MAFQYSNVFTLGATALLPGGKDAYGSKPVVPGGIDYESSLRNIIQSNIDLLPSLTELGLMSTDSLNALLERTLPGFTNLRDTTTGILEKKLKGEFSDELRNQLDRDLQESGIAMGTSGSGFDRNRGVYGKLLAGYAIQNEGLAQTSSWLAQNRGNTFDFTKMFLGPAEAVRETEFNWNRDWLAAQVEAAPDPVARGELETEMAASGMVLGAYAGGYQPQQRYQDPTAGSSVSAGGISRYGEQAAMGGRSYFGDSGGATIGYTPTNYNARVPAHFNTNTGADSFDFNGGADFGGYA